MGFLIFIAFHRSCKAALQMMKTETPEPHAPCLPDSIRQSSPAYHFCSGSQGRRAGPEEKKSFLGPSFPREGGSRISRWEGLEEGPEGRTLDNCGGRSPTP